MCVYCFYNFINFFYLEFTAAEELTNTKGENITVYKPQSLNMKELDSNNIPNSGNDRLIFFLIIY